MRWRPTWADHRSRLMGSSSAAASSLTASAGPILSPPPRWRSAAELSGRHGATGFGPTERGCSASGDVWAELGRLSNDDTRVGRAYGGPSERPRDGGIPRLVLQRWPSVGEVSVGVIGAGEVGAGAARRRHRSRTSRAAPRRRMPHGMADGGIVRPIFATASSTSGRLAACARSRGGAEESDMPPA
ncbi:MAG: hypothetical protein JWM18_4065 [Chloroflexi bacterium]|nr:hypothetical protein [Chloroflexota bacterium]